MDNQNNEEVEVFTCTKCGAKEVYPKGYLTEQAKNNFKCKACRELVVERQVDIRNKGDKELLVE
ncbi:hypothetical protein GF374_03445 [Candidatus Woesearchaeota archaeon]|nr:hypothetical protein [Candidatus Woesearchaeota archaeon]